MVDFSNCRIDPLRIYGGANGSKIGIEYEGEKYMLKFPSLARKNPNLSYSSSTICEHISCKILDILGLPVQKTLLGVFDKNGAEKVVVACQDFCYCGKQKMYEVKDFAYLKNSIIDSEMCGYGTELEEILLTIDEQTIVDATELKRFFWQMFVADAYIGNFDRHNGNWGFLLNERTAKIAPIFDCGSCLFPQADEEIMTKVMTNDAELKNRLYIYPNSAVKINGEKIKYFDFLGSDTNKDATNALIEIEDRIKAKEDDIFSMIQEIECLPQIAKDFYCYMLQKRRELGLEKAKDNLLSSFEY